MTWRKVQLGEGLCDQDQLILNFFGQRPVKYVGHDQEFASHLNCANNASNLILIVNHPVWCSDIKKLCIDNLTGQVRKFYLGINRYQILGNDLVEQVDVGHGHGQNIIFMITAFVNQLGFDVLKSGAHDHDRGRHFNFVQPLTWIYGINKTN